MNTLLGQHIEALTQRWSKALDAFGYDGAWLSAGSETLHFQDDQGPPFKANPYLCQWLSAEFVTPDAKLLLRPGKRPQLFIVQPQDYWHVSVPGPEHMQAHFDIHTFATPAEQLSACQQASGADLRMARIGPEGADNESMGEPNPAGLIDHLHFHRARKTEYELAAMRIASDVGARGHKAAAAAFRAGGSEFDIHMAYLAASRQNEAALPYGNIIALNEHARVLHYKPQDREPPAESLSLLIDAGGEHLGYASDITRTYAAEGHDEFAGLIELMQGHQDQLLAAVAPGLGFADLHVQMHQQLAELLVAADLVTCSADAALNDGLTSCFCPHGLGHLLGLQVHDVGGHLADAEGNPAPPPAAYPSLRFTREIERDHVFTIEPGLYFIPMLLEEQRAQNAPVNWQTVERLAPYGGIRIEDNVRVLADGIENLTRDAFARVADEG